MAIAFVESSVSGAGHAVINAALNMGLSPILLSIDPNRYNLPFPGLARLKVNTLDSLEVVKAAKSIPDLQGLGTTYEYFTVVAADAARALGLPGPDPEAVANCRSKASTRMVLSKSAPELIPSFRIIKKIDELEDIGATLGYPVVLKSPELTGGGCVEFAFTKEEVIAKGSALLSLQAYAGRQLNGIILAEGFLEGPEFSVETFDDQIIAITKKVVFGAEGLIERGHDVPAVLPDQVNHQISAATLDALRALGLTWGPAHTEIKITPTGPKIVEVNARLGGGRITDLVKEATGVDYAKALVDKLIGQPSDIQKRATRFASVRFAVLDHSGTIENVEGLQEAALVPNIQSVGTLAKAGYVHNRTGNNRDRLAWALSVAQTPSEAARAAELAASNIVFRMKDGLVCKTPISLTHDQI